MSLASAVVLLQTVLSLLTLVNSNPSLPQSMRDNATAVAQHAISEAHAALASKATPADEGMAQATVLAASSTKAGPAYVYPNPTLTLGAVLTTDASTICAPGYASSVRDVSTATKEQVYAEYGVSYPEPLARMKWIILFRSKSAAQTTSKACGWNQRHPRRASIKKISSKTSNMGRCATDDKRGGGATPHGF